MATNKLPLQVMRKLQRKLRIHQYIFLIGQIYGWLYILFYNKFLALCRFGENSAALSL